MKIIIDVTEPQALINMLAELCSKKGVLVERLELRHHKNVTPETLKKNPFMGSNVDYLVIDKDGKPVLAFERKTYRDAVLSMLQKEKGESRRFFRQLDNLKKFPERVLILEGSLPPNYSRFSSHIYGLQFWSYRNQIGVVHTPDLNGSAKAIFVLARKVLGLS